MAFSAYVDIKHALEVWRYMAGWPTKIEGKTLPLSGTLVGRVSNTRFSPPDARADGRVSGLIIVLEFPFLLATWEMRARRWRRAAPWC